MNLKELAYHALIGNDTAPWIVAGARGLLSALILGGISFFSIWSQTDDVKLLISTPGTVFLSTLIIRWGLEGTIDARKNGGTQ